MLISPSLQDISQRITAIKRRLRELSRPDVLLVAVTKQRSTEDIKKLIRLGHRVIGENRFGEARDKIKELAAEEPQDVALLDMHHLGPVQKGNASQIVRLFSSFHGVSNLSGLHALLQESLRRRDKDIHTKRSWPLSYFIQIRLTNEVSKLGGLSEEAFFSSFLSSGKGNYPENDALAFRGLMAMGPESQDPVECAELFCKLRELRDAYAPGKKLSMGMSGDWEIAVRAGSDIIRLGSALWRRAAAVLS